MEYFNRTTEEYYNILNSNNHQIVIKLELLDHYENVIGEITKELTSNDNGSISIDYEQGIQRKCSFTLKDTTKMFLPNEDSFIWINQKFKLWLGIKSYNTYWFSQGIFFFKNVSASPYELKIDGIDKFGIFTSDLNQHCLQGTYKIPVGTNVYSAVTGTLALDMGNGLPLDPIKPRLDLSMMNEVFPYDISKDADSFLGDILTEIGTSLNADVYYDTDGVLNYTTSKIDTYIRNPITHIFSDKKGNIFNLNVDYDLGNVINVCKVYGTDVDGLIHSYVAKNDNPSSPTRISLIGEKCEKVEESDMCYNDKRCHDYGEYQLNQKSAVAMSYSFDCPLIPHLNCNDIISITHDYYNFNNEECLITSITMPIGLDDMRISACNIKYLPAYPPTKT